MVAQGIELFGDSIPAGVVGGDYFGVWQPTADALHFCVADVSGKGTPGALIAAMLYASVSTLSSSSNNPESVLAQVETTLRNQLGEGHYVTIFYAVLDLRTRVLHYVNAGHCPPILRRRNGAMESLAPDSPGAGIHAGRGLPLRASRAWSPGTVCCCTPTASARRPMTRKKNSVRSGWRTLVNGPDDETMQDRYAAIMDKVSAHAAGKFTDDATLLLLSVNDAAPATSSRVHPDA